MRILSARQISRECLIHMMVRIYQAGKKHHAFCVYDLVSIRLLSGPDAVNLILLDENPAGSEVIIFRIHRNGQQRIFY